MLYQALSSVYGKIQTLLITHQGYRKNVTPEELERQYGGIFRAFGDRVRFYVLCNLKKDSENMVEAKRETEKIFKEVMQGSDLNPDHHFVMIQANAAEAGLAKHDRWAQDNFTMLQSGDDQVVFLEPYFKNKSANHLVAEQVASVTDILIKPSSFKLEGGNILVGDDYALVGMDLLFDNILFALPGGKNDQEGGLTWETVLQDQYFKKEVETLTENLKRQMGVRYLYWIGSETPFAERFEGNWRLVQSRIPKHQPLFHLDLFMTLGGLETIQYSGDELVYLASIREEYVCGPGKASFSKDWKNLAESLKEVRKSLENIGRTSPGPRFNVWEIPLVLWVEQTGKMIPYSLNNVHVEWYQGVRRLYYPEYRIREEELSRQPEKQELEKAFRLAEKEARSTWENVCLPILVAGNFTEISENGHGSLHCMTKVLKRSSKY